MQGERYKALDSIAERFWSKVDVRGLAECWLWQAGTNGSPGYGQFALGRKLARNLGICRTALAHRVAYELEGGPIPEGLELHHRCENTLCVNPRHLVPLERKPHLHLGRSFAAAKAAQTHCVNGHPLSGDNLIVENGRRQCRACRRERDRKRQRLRFEARWTCSVEGCERPGYAKGRCRACYERDRRAASALG